MRGMLDNPLAAGGMATLLLILPLFMPLLAVIQIVAPLPILAHTVLSGVQSGMQALVLVLIASALVLDNGQQMMLLVFYFNLFPLLAGWLLRGGWTVRQCAVVAFVLVMSILLAGTLVASLLDHDLAASTASLIIPFRDHLLTEGASLLDSDITARVQFQEAITVYADMVARFLPAMMLAIWFIVQVINLAMVRNLLVKLAQPLADQESLADFRLPHGLIWLFIGAVGLISLSGNPAYLGANLLMFITVPYAIQGMAILSAVFRRFKVHAAMRMAFWTAMLLFKSLMLSIILLGILDTWFDFRRLLSPSAGDSTFTR